MTKLALVNRDLLLEQREASSFNHRSKIQVNSSSISAVHQLNAKGYSLVLITHQPGISRGLLDLDELEAIHSKIISAVEADDGEITALFYCPHDQSDHCHCRPPLTGLLDVVEIEFDCSMADAVYFYQTPDEEELIKTKGAKGIFCDASVADASAYDNNNDKNNMSFAAAVEQWLSTES